MALYHCTLTLHDNVFFATREMGILYETEKYLHNWGLSFALFAIHYIPQPYRLQGELAQKPTYLDASAEQNLLHLNQAGIYVFPAQPINWSYQINTFKAAQVAYYGKSKQFGDKGAYKNYPINYGRAKEIAIGSEYRTYIITPDAINALLGFAYGLLQVQVTAAVHMAGLDPYIGYLHEATRGQPAMVLDLMEEFRPLIADNLILSVISHKEIKPDDFTDHLGVYRLLESGRKQFLQAWERKMNDEFKHPTFGYRCSYRRAIELQARLLSRHLQEGVPYKALTLR
ncbi:MAG: CRISPR-associated endonuclease Cas1 [Nostoc sp.]|uniref:CRISPR-associated endonuclease Cas1 n=1 Tax=Nostoc sp. TaxID=1180 RepID=UPI002FF6201F